MSVDQTLAGIDAALDSWETRPDAARWHADGGPDKLAGADAAEHLTRWLSGIVAGLTEFGRLVTVTLVPAMNGFLKDAAPTLHILSALRFPRQHRRCVTCHPWSRPLAINGSEYRRRQRARGKRRR